MRFKLFRQAALDILKPSQKVIAVDVDRPANPDNKKGGGYAAGNH